MMTNTRVHLFIAHFTHWFQFGFTEKLPWWSDSSRYMPLPTGTRGWEGKYLQPLLEPMALSEIGSLNLRTIPQSNHAEFIIVKGDLEKDQTTAIGSLFGFSKDSLRSALRFEVPSYANAAHVHEHVKIAMIRAGHDFRYNG